MKLTLVLAALTCYLGFTLGFAPAGPARDSRTPKDMYVLSTDAKKDTDKAKAVPFNHVTHSTKNYSVDGTRPIACVECHHTDQPAAEAAKTPPLKSAFPEGRTTTLTADLFQKQPDAPEVPGCRACHAQEGQKPRLWPEIPQVTYEGDPEPTALDNEIAYHANCNTCHDDAVKARPSLKIPTSQECAACHTGKTQ